MAGAKCEGLVLCDGCPINMLSEEQRAAIIDSRLPVIALEELEAGRRPENLPKVRDAATPETPGEVNVVVRCALRNFFNYEHLRRPA